MSVTLINEEFGQVEVPTWVVDLKSFLRWADTVEFPEKGRLWYLKGKVWVDMSKEQVFAHVQIKGEFTRCLTGLALSEESGYYFTDGLFYSNDDADIGGQPDGTFVLFTTLESAVPRPTQGRGGGYGGRVGAPDVGVEVVRRRSVGDDS